MKWLIALAILVSVIALWLTVTADYGDAQTATATPTPSIYDVLPVQQPHHSSDVNFSGAVNVIDLFLVAGDMGESGAKGVCAHIISGSPPSWFDGVTCP